MDPLKDDGHVRTLATVVVADVRGLVCGLLHVLVPAAEEGFQDLAVSVAPDLSRAAQTSCGKELAQVVEPLWSTALVVVDHSAAVEKDGCGHLGRVL